MCFGLGARLPFGRTRRTPDEDVSPHPCCRVCPRRDGGDRPGCACAGDAARGTRAGPERALRACAAGHRARSRGETRTTRPDGIARAGGGRGDAGGGSDRERPPRGDGAAAGDRRAAGGVGEEFYDRDSGDRDALGGAGRGLAAQSAGERRRHAGDAHAGLLAGAHGGDAGAIAGGDGAPAAAESVPRFGPAGGAYQLAECGGVLPVDDRARAGGGAVAAGLRLRAADRGAVGKRVPRGPAGAHAGGVGRGRVVRAEQRRDDPSGRTAAAECVGILRHAGQRGGVVSRRIPRLSGRARAGFDDRLRRAVGSDGPHGARRRVGHPGRPVSSGDALPIPDQPRWRRRGLPPRARADPDAARGQVARDGPTRSSPAALSSTISPRPRRARWPCVRRRRLPASASG